MTGLTLRLRQTKYRIGCASWLTALGFCCVDAAQGEANPYYIGAAQRFTHDSNLVRLADNQDLPVGVSAKSDSVAITSVLAGIDQPFGRQRFYANASVHDSRFRDNTIYDNTGYGLSAGVDWSTRERVSGSLSASSNQKLASFNLNEPVEGSNTARVVTKRNSETTDQLSAVVRVGMVTPVTLEGEVSHKRLDYSTEDFNFREFDQNSVEFRGRYRSSANLTLGSGLRLTRGEYPFARTAVIGVSAIDKYTGRHLSLTATWEPSGLSTIKGRVNLGRTKHSLSTQKTFTGATGSLDWDWLPTGKLRMNTQLRRDTAEDSAFISVADSAVGENTRLTTAISVSGRYQATDKVEINTGLSWAQRSLRAQIQGNANAGDDRTSVVRIGASYAPTRIVQMSCNVSHESRSASGELSYAYTANVFGCSAQVTLGR